MNTELRDRLAQVPVGSDPRQVLRSGSGEVDLRGAHYQSIKL